ncbi:MAG: 4-alpha-glucanotransferase [Roseobacter sp.]
MNTDQTLKNLADLVGVFPEYKDMQRRVHVTTPDTQRAMLRANGLAVDTDAEVEESHAALLSAHSVQYVAHDVVVKVATICCIQVRAPVTWSVLSESSGNILAEGRSEDSVTLPALPVGLHVLHLDGPNGKQSANLIVAPASVPSLNDLTGQEHVWGGMAALYGLTGDAPKSLGDFHDLAELAQVFGQHGAAFLGVNPVHALGGAATETISPYSPTHRGFLNTDHIHIQRAQPQKLLPLIDYAAHRDGHHLALENAFKQFRDRAETSETAAFEQFCKTGGAGLDDFALFETISAIHGADWRNWPDDVPTAAQADPTRVLFHKWMQWRADAQLTRAQQQAIGSGMSLGLYLDLAVGARVGGAESWGKTAATATGVTLGAPPDHLSPAGQNWQLAALSPRKLQQGRYDALRFVLQQNMRHSGVLRIDHALGLTRSFWIPEDGSPGGYIRQPSHALMAIIAIEAQKAGTVIVGEDLGLVPTGFREEMAKSGLYGYSVLQYEKDSKGCFTSAQDLRPQSLACFGTHDTPTLAGFWQCGDIQWWEKLGWIDAPDAVRAKTLRDDEKRQLAGVSAPEVLPKQVTPALRDKIHATLAQSPAALVAVQLEDILGLSDAQNLPGTVDEHPNWRRRYPLSIQQIKAGQDIENTAAIMTKAGRASQLGKDRT